MNRVVSYLRFSSGKQSKGDSKRRQTDDGDEWVKRNNLTYHSLTLRDLGVSAFRGKHRHKGALGEFLRAIDDGRVEAGDFLMVENLDRLSREEMTEALPLFLNIINHGIKVVTLKPLEKVYDKKNVNEGLGIVEPLMAFSNAHLESKKKSERCGQAWAQKRKRAITGEKFGGRCPAWIDWDKDRKCYRPNDGAKAVRYIFERTCDGVGQRKLTQELQRKFPAIGRSGHWCGSYIQSVLANRNVLGEFHPCKMTEDGERIQQGDKPIADYYPRIIDAALWNRAQKAKATRYKQRGPNGQFVNLFTSIVINARDKSPMHIRRVCPHGRDIQRRLVSSKHLRKEKGADSLTFDYPAFERHVLTFLSELTPADLQPAAKRSKVNAIEKLQDERAAVEGRLRELQAMMRNPKKKLDSILPVIGELEKDHKMLGKQIEMEQQKVAVQDTNPLSKAKSILEMLEENPDSQSLRLRLRAAITNVIDSIYMLPISSP